MNKLERQDRELEERRTEQRHRALMESLDDLHCRLDMVAATVEALLAASGPTALTEGPGPVEGGAQ